MSNDDSEVYDEVITDNLPFPQRFTPGFPTSPDMAAPSPITEDEALAEDTLPGMGQLYALDESNLPAPIRTPEGFPSLKAPHGRSAHVKFKETVYDGPMVLSLDETTTSPVEWEPEATVLQLEQVLREICAMHGFLERGMPFVESFVWDTVLKMPHIHIHLRVPFVSPTTATQEGVRYELDQYAEALCGLMKCSTFAVSAKLD